MRSFEHMSTTHGAGLVCFTVAVRKFAVLTSLRQMSTGAFQGSERASCKSLNNNNKKNQHRGERSINLETSINFKEITINTQGCCCCWTFTQLQGKIFSLELVVWFTYKLCLLLSSFLSVVLVTKTAEAVFTLFIFIWRWILRRIQIIHIFPLVLVINLPLQRSPNVFDMWDPRGDSDNKPVSLIFWLSLPCAVLFSRALSSFH